MRRPLRSAIAMTALLTSALAHAAPLELEVDARPVSPGQTIELVVTGAATGERIYFVRAEVSGTTCPTALAGQCLTGRNAVLLGDRRANGSGEAHLSITVPGTAPVGASTRFQAARLNPGAPVLSDSELVELVPACALVDYWVDADGDGFGDPATATQACAPQPTWVTNADDCDDSSTLVSPNADETCSGVDDDCDGTIDEGFNAVPGLFATVQAAIDGVADFEEICVAPGVYTENVVVDNRVVSIVGAGIDATVIDAGESGRVFTVSTAAGLYLTDLTVSGGRATEGAGARVSDESGLIAERVRFTNNRCVEGGCRGGALHSVGASLSLFDVVLDDNSILSGTAPQDGNLNATYGGVIYAAQSTVSWEDVSMIDNSAEVTGPSHDIFGSMAYLHESSLTADRVELLGNRGLATCVGCRIRGGLHLSYTDATLRNLVVAGNAIDASFQTWGIALTNYGGGTIVLENATIRGNTVISGVRAVGGMVTQYLGSEALTLRNVAFTNNSVTAPFPQGFVLWYRDGSSPPNVSYGNVFGNVSSGILLGIPGAGEASDWFGMADPTGTAGNVSVAPGYVDGSGMNAYRWDLHLRPTSSMVDAGDPSLTDVDGSRSDIGAYGGPGGDW